MTCEVRNKESNCQCAELLVRHLYNILYVGVDRSKMLVIGALTISNYLEVENINQ